MIFFRWFLYVIVASGAMLLMAPHGSAEPIRPNVVIILADDMGYADIGVHGCRDIPTPNIDRIATRGIRFTDAYANGSFCTPTRAALMSGRYQQRIGNEDLDDVTGPLPLAVPTLPERLRAVGYATGLVGKWHLGLIDGYTPLDRGFDEFFGILGGGHHYLPRPPAAPATRRGTYTSPIQRNRTPVEETRYLTTAFGEEAAAFIERREPTEEPFFLYLAFNAVHTPLEATAEYLDRFSDIADPRRRTYAAMQAAMDDAVGLVLRALEKTGASETTLVIFTNDNGGPTTRNAVNGSSNAPLRGSKCETFEGGIRVPLLMQWPAVLPAGQTYEQPVMTCDITATVLAVAGGDASGGDGVDLIPFVTGAKHGPPHEALFWRCRMRSNNFAARVGNWKFVHSTEGDATPGPKQTPARDMLFDLGADIGETNDLSADHPEKRAELKARYEAWSDAVDADHQRLVAFQRPRLKFPDEKLDVWHGHRRHSFRFEGRSAWVVEPEQPRPGNPWSWCMMFPDAFTERCAAPQLLDAGFHHAYLDVGNTFGSPEAIKRLAAFHDELVRRGLAPKAALIGISRGGLYAQRYAAEHPDHVAVIYGDNPVCDFKSWPGGKGAGKGSLKDWAACLAAYGFPDETAALAYPGNPIDTLAPLAAANIAMVHVVGDRDEVVPPAENTLVVEERYRKLGGEILVIHEADKGHHPHGLADPQPVVDFVIKHASLDRR
jgi:arylsulfatase A-like enzyme/pimeloyl-ACP methyl ester carboxylesterase